MRKFWNVIIEVDNCRKIKAAILHIYLAENQPENAYKREPRRDIYSLWYNNEVKARNAVIEALSMNEKQVVVNDNIYFIQQYGKPEYLLKSEDVA